ncbi:hypothetical protein [Butyrivibrio sp. YAB3001]|uniref:hypothetical protein n=1 Tax=Butyrivibrio sp. YAB3001 TaxID=1520812 RepID=UPI0008F636D6|nr:hypothetical protein [Butyrivibrio sp. YAB3001]SFC22868.1 hypothetical protein SAMN02910398_01810 [Butyrivibrio sp. YAB3001]
MVAKNNEYMSSTLKSMYLSNADYNVIKVAREREEFLRYQEHILKQNAEMSSEISELNKKLAEYQKIMDENGIKY